MEKSISGKVQPLNGVVSDAATSAHGAIDKAASAAGSVVQTVSAGIDQAATSSHQAVRKAENTVRPAEAWIHEKAAAALAAPKNAVADARQFIVTHPWQSVGTALVVGMLLGRKTR